MGVECCLTIGGKGASERSILQDGIAGWLVRAKMEKLKWSVLKGEVAGLKPEQVHSMLQDFISGSTASFHSAKLVF